MDVTTKKPSKDSKQNLLDASIESFLVTIDVICNDYKDENNVLRDVLTKLDDRVIKLRHLLQVGVRPKTAPSKILDTGDTKKNTNDSSKYPKQKLLHDTENLVSSLRLHDKHVRLSIQI